jgi:hypothetical protein
LSSVNLVENVYVHVTSYHRKSMETHRFLKEFLEFDPALECSWSADAREMTLTP